MKKKWLRIALPILVVVLLVLAGIWYTRPMTIAELLPELDMEHPGSLYVYTYRYHMDEFSQEKEPLELNLTEGDPRYEEFRTILESIRFRRTIKGLLTDLFNRPIGTEIEDGMVNWTLHLQGSHFFALQYFDNKFYCNKSAYYEYNHYRECRMENHDEVADALTSLILAYSTLDEGIN